MDTALKQLKPATLQVYFVACHDLTEMHNEIIYRLISPITSRRLIKKYKPDDIVCFQISSNLCDKWEKNIFLNVIFATF